MIAQRKGKVLRGLTKVVEVGKVGTVLEENDAAVAAVRRRLPIRNGRHRRRDPFLGPVIDTRRGSRLRRRRIDLVARIGAVATLDDPDGDRDRGDHDEQRAEGEEPFREGRFARPPTAGTGPTGSTERVIVSRAGGGGVILLAEGAGVAGTGSATGEDFLVAEVAVTPAGLSAGGTVAVHDLVQVGARPPVGTAAADPAVDRSAIRRRVPPARVTSSSVKGVIVARGGVVRASSGRGSRSRVWHARPERIPRGKVTRGTRRATVLGEVRRRCLLWRVLGIRRRDDLRGLGSDGPDRRVGSVREGDRGVQVGGRALLLRGVAARHGESAYPGVRAKGYSSSRTVWVSSRARLVVGATRSGPSLSTGSKRRSDWNVRCTLVSGAGVGENREKEGRRVRRCWLPSDAMHRPRGLLRATRASSGHRTTSRRYSS